MTLQPTHPAPGPFLCPAPQGKRPRFASSLPCLRRLPQAASRARRGTSTLRLCRRHPGCRAPAPRSRFPAPQDRGFLVLCPPQPRCGSPRATSLPRPAAAPAVPPHPCPPPSLPGQGSAGGVPSVCGSLRRVRARASHPALRGRCTGMLCPPGSVHTVKSNCLKAVVFGFCFLPPVPSHPPCPVPFTHFTWLERCLLAPVLTPAAWRSQPALFDTS